MTLKRQQCPYVGLENDPDTHLAYPSVRNVCHRAHPKQVVNLAHQQTYCLTSLHHQCLVFTQPAESPLPFELRAFHPRPWPTRCVVVLIVGLFLVLAVIFGVWSLLAMPATPTVPVLMTGTLALENRGVTPIAASLTPTNVPLVVTPALPTVTVGSTAVPPSSTQATRVATMPSSPTAKVCVPPAGWVIYIVRPGDTLYQLAQTFGVSIAQLQEGNCMTTAMLMAGGQLYVPNVATRTSTAASTAAYTITATTTEALPLTPTPFPTDIPTFTLPPTATLTVTTAPYP